MRYFTMSSARIMMMLGLVDFVLVDSSLWTAPSINPNASITTKNLIPEHIFFLSFDDMIIHWQIQENLRRMTIWNVNNVQISSINEPEIWIRKISYGMNKNRWATTVLTAFTLWFIRSVLNVILLNSNLFLIQLRTNLWCAAI